MQTDPDKIAKVKDCPVPINAGDRKLFHFFAGYYRRFVKDFSKLVRPLAELLPPTSTKRITGRSHRTFLGCGHQNSSPSLYVLKIYFVLLMFFHILMFHFRFNGIQMRQQNIGAMLYQTQDGMKRVIAYASRALTKLERRYSAYRLEFLDHKWAETEKIVDYIAANHFTILTDNKIP